MSMATNGSLQQPSIAHARTTSQELFGLHDHLQEMPRTPFQDVPRRARLDTLTRRDVAEESTEIPQRISCLRLQGPTGSNCHEIW